VSIQTSAAKLLQKKVAGIPVPVLAAGAGAAYWWWSSSSSGTAETTGEETTGEEPLSDVGSVPAFDEGGAAFGPGSSTTTINKTTYNYARKKKRRRCPQGKKWSVKKKRCVRVRSTSIANGRGTGRVPTSTSRVVAARRR
jgi:hypothetical protein